MFELNTITGVVNLILAAFSIPEPPIAKLPPPLVVAGATLRPGLSAKAIASEIISRQSKAGRQVGNVFTDGDNVEETMELIRVEEIINAILTQSVVNVAIAPGVSVTSIGTGNLGIPVVSQGYTTTIASGNGIIR